MKRLLPFLVCALAILIGSESLSEAQKKTREPPAGRSYNKSRIVALNTNGWNT